MKVNIFAYGRLYIFPYYLISMDIYFTKTHKGMK